MLSRFLSADSIDGTTQYGLVLMGLALQGIGSLNIIPHLFVTEPPTFFVGVLPRRYANHHNFMLGDLFKNTGTSLVDPVFPLDISQK